MNCTSCLQWGGQPASTENDKMSERLTIYVFDRVLQQLVQPKNFVFRSGRSVWKPFITYPSNKSLRKAFGYKFFIYGKVRQKVAAYHAYDLIIKEFERTEIHDHGSDKF